MLTRHVLKPDDLAGLVASVFAYNQRGDVVAIAFYDSLGRPVEIGYAEAIAESPPLRVRQEPESSIEDRLTRLAVGGEPVDPRAIPGAASLTDLATIARV